MKELLHDAYQALKRSAKNYPHGVARALLTVSRDAVGAQAPSAEPRPNASVGALPVIFVFPSSVSRSELAENSDTVQRFGAAGSFLAQAIEKGMKRDLRTIGACISASELSRPDKHLAGARFVIAFGAEATAALGLPDALPLNSWQPLATLKGVRAVRSVEIPGTLTDAGEKRLLWDTLKLLMSALDEETR